MTDAVPPKSPPRAQIEAIIRRYLKPEITTPDWRREFSTFHGLWKQYPSLDFWTRHELPFKLNSLVWFRGADGQAQLASDWIIFFFTFAEDTVPVDKTP